MRLAFCVTTYNRLGYLQALLSSFAKTRDFRHDWRVYVVDDGSTDGTVEFLRTQAVHLVQQPRLGVHEAKNRLFEAALSDGCDFGWQVDDDVVFRVSGWDRAYIDAAEASGFEHLVLYDSAWARQHRQDGTFPLRTAQHLQSAVPMPQACQGACWTFSPSVVERVGWFDVVGFGPCGYAHTDYTLRACRAGCNQINTAGGPWDALHSERYVHLQRSRYMPAIPAGKRASAAFGHTPLEVKIAMLNDSGRVYVPRQKPRWDMEGNDLG
jgi:GT2 family glycosyltransferase